MRQLLLGASFLLGMLAGCYATAVAVEGHAQSPEVSAAISQAARAHGVSERWMRAIAACESTFRPWVTSRGGHMGLYQFAATTWRWMSRQAGLAGADPYDPWAAAMVAAWGLRNGYAHHWSCA